MPIRTKKRRKQVRKLKNSKISLCQIFSDLPQEPDEYYVHKETLERVAMSEETRDVSKWKICREEKEENVKLFIARRFFGALDHRFFKSFPRRANLAPQLQRRLRKKRKTWTFDIFGVENEDGTYRTETYHIDRNCNFTREIYNEDGSWNPDFLHRWDSGKDSASPVCRRAHELFEQLQDPLGTLASSGLQSR